MFPLRESSLGWVRRRLSLRSGSRGREEHVVTPAKPGPVAGVTGVVGTTGGWYVSLPRVLLGAPGETLHELLVIPVLA